MVSSKGACKNGDKCTFAHGDEELKAETGSFHQKPQTNQYNNFQRNQFQPIDPKNNYLDTHILNEQLIWIAENLGMVYGSRPEIMIQLKNAVDLLNSGQINSSADLLHVFLAGYSQQQRVKEEQ